MGSNKTIRDPMYGYIKIDYPSQCLLILKNSSG